MPHPGSPSGLDAVEGIDVVGFDSTDAMCRWLSERGTSTMDPGVWVRLGKAGNRGTGPTLAELLEAGIAFGWSEGMRRACDAETYLQRFLPRRRRGTKSRRNLAIAERLVAEGRMTTAGLAALALDEAIPYARDVRG